MMVACWSPDYYVNVYFLLGQTDRDTGAQALKWMLCLLLMAPGLDRLLTRIRRLYIKLYLDAWLKWYVICIQMSNWWGKGCPILVRLSGEWLYCIGYWQHLPSMKCITYGIVFLHFIQLPMINVCQRKSGSDKLPWSSFRLYLHIVFQG